MSWLRPHPRGALYSGSRVVNLVVVTHMTTDSFSPSLTALVPCDLRRDRDEGL